MGWCSSIRMTSCTMRCHFGHKWKHSHWKDIFLSWKNKFPSELAISNNLFLLLSKSGNHHYSQKWLVFWMTTLALKFLTLKSIFEVKLHKKFTWCVWHVTRESFMQFCFEKIYLLPMMLKFIYSKKASKSFEKSPNSFWCYICYFK